MALNGCPGSLAPLLGFWAGGGGALPVRVEVKGACLWEFPENRESIDLCRCEFVFFLVLGFCVYPCFVYCYCIDRDLKRRGRGSEV